MREQAHGARAQLGLLGLSRSAQGDTKTLALEISECVERVEAYLLGGIAVLHQGEQRGSSTLHAETNPTEVIVELEKKVAALELMNAALEKKKCDDPS